MADNRIIVQQLHGHWSAWWETCPQVSFGGATPAEAVDRLIGFSPLPQKGLQDTGVH